MGKGSVSIAEALSTRITDSHSSSLGLGCEVACKPIRREARHFFQRSWLLKKMRGSGDDDEFLFAAPERSQCLLVQVDYGCIIAPNNQECWRDDGTQRVSC